MHYNETDRYFHLDSSCNIAIHQQTFQIVHTPHQRIHKHNKRRTSECWCEYWCWIRLQFRILSPTVAVERRQHRRHQPNQTKIIYIRVTVQCAHMQSPREPTESKGKRENIYSSHWEYIVCRKCCAQHSSQQTHTRANTEFESSPLCTQQNRIHIRLVGRCVRICVNVSVNTAEFYVFVCVRFAGATNLSVCPIACMNPQRIMCSRVLRWTIFHWILRIVPFRARTHTHTRTAHTILISHANYANALKDNNKWIKTCGAPSTFE